jgi:hypothetical protein
MVRASGSLNSQVKMNFAASYSATEGNAQFSAEKQAGGRVSFYLPGPRVEIGASYLRVLGDDRFNVSGLDFVWNARRTPVDVRGEFVWADVEGKGYWLEAAYRLSNVTTNRFFRRSQIVGRVEQYFAPSVPQEDNGDLPVLNTQRYTAGFNYWPSDSVKLCASFGRQIDSSESQNIWTVGIVYRFALGKGE